MSTKHTPRRQIREAFDALDGNPQLFGLLDFGLPQAGDRVTRYSQHEGFEFSGDRESNQQEVGVGQSQFMHGLRTKDARQRSVFGPKREALRDWKQQSLTDRFRNPPVGRRIAAVGTAFAMPGTLAGAMVGLFVGGFALCAIVGAIVGAGFGVWLETWSR